jgi:hypothetical protein
MLIFIPVIGELLNGLPPPAGVGGQRRADLLDGSQDTKDQLNRDGEFAELSRVILPARRKVPPRSVLR